MRLIRITIILLLISFPLASFSTSKVHNPPRNLQDSVRRILSRASVVKPNLNYGVIIENANTGKILFSRQSHHLYPPASVQKMFTAIAALSYLGSDFHFTTKLLTHGQIKDRTLWGDLTVKFSGDPEFKTKDLNDLIAELKKLGINRITGHIYIDNMDYGPVPYAPGWMWDDLSYSYAAPLNAIIIDRNKFSLQFIPAQKGKVRPKIYPALPAGVVQIDNEVITTSRFIKKCPLTIYSDIHNNYRLAGCINRRSGQQQRALAIRDPDLYAKILIEQALQSNKIGYTGTIKFRKAGANSILLAEHLSPPLNKMLKEMLKNSDNLTADSLLKKMGKIYYEEQGTWQNGLRAMKLILKPTGIDFKHNLLNDGAGLSRYNLVSPSQLTKLLYYAYHNPNIRKLLISALPIGATDGTLIGRMWPIVDGRRVHAKTGSMTGVTTLSGYIYSRYQGTLIFAIMMNGFVGKDRPLLHIEDKMCDFLAHYKGKHDE